MRCYCALFFDVSAVRCLLCVVVRSGVLSVVCCCLLRVGVMCVVDRLWCFAVACCYTCSIDVLVTDVLCRGVVA